ncbi:hypothetical protein VNO80_30672 [Phaseolus coccineus]|uniref:Uncharacterized protein n=1 Tax=Phaseolus coccineus TaxID=3886 RepID=A0AAN9QGC3_PHACN
MISICFQGLDCGCGPSWEKHVEEEWCELGGEATRLRTGSDGWICNTVEMEPLGLQLLRKYLESPIWIVRLLLPPNALKGSKHRGGKESGIALEACMEWF